MEIINDAAGMVSTADDSAWEHSCLKQALKDMAKPIKAPTNKPIIIGATMANLGKLNLRKRCNGLTNGVISTAKPIKAINIPQVIDA